MSARMVLVAHAEPDGALHDILADLLREKLADNQDEFDADEVAAMIAVTHARGCDAAIELDGTTQPVTLIGVTIDLPDEAQFPDRVLDEFTEAVNGTEPFAHALRFEDERLKEELARMEQAG